MRNMKLSLVVPCYNEQENVEAFLDACTGAFHNRISSYEIIFINDGSRDRTWEVLKALHRREKNVKVICFSRNFGKEAAMYAGLQRAVGEYVTLIDADLQQRPEIVCDMVEFLEENSDFDSVAAYQVNRREGKLMSFCKNAFYSLVNKLCDVDFKSNASDFRTFRRGVAEAILEMKEYFRFSKGIFAWIGFNTHYIPYEAAERKAGESSWSFWKLMKYAMEGIVAFTTFPLKLATYCGSVFSILSLLYMLVVIIQKIFWGIDVPGYPTLIVAILFVGGIQMLMMGIIGQYVSKIYIEGKHRPIYLIREYLE